MGSGPRVRDWTVVFGRDEEAHYRGRWLAPRVAVRLLSTQRPSHQLYDLWTQAPCHRLGCFGARRARFSAASQGTSGRVFLEKGFTPRAVVTLSHSLQLLCPFAFELSAPLCIRVPLLFAAVVAMASLAHLERFQSEGALNLVRNLLRWGAPAFAERIRAGASPLGDLTAG
jgi:hypothetical protein